MCHGDYSSGRRKTSTSQAGFRSSPMVGVRFSYSGPSPASCYVGTDYASSGLEGSWEGMCPPAETDHWETHRHLASLISPLELQGSLRSLFSDFLPNYPLCQLWRASPTSHSLLRMCFLPKGLSWAFRGKRREIIWFSQA